MFYQTQHFGLSEYFHKETGRNFSFPMHMHHSFELITIIEGSMTVIVGNDKYELKKDTLLDKFPDVAKEWHPTKNGELKPSMFKAGTDHKVWWLCPTCGNEYEAAINKRATNKNPTGCPKCGLRKVALSKSRKVNMIDPSTNKIIKTFNSIKEAGNELKINNSNIGMVCRGQRNYAGGYKWSYA